MGLFIHLYANPHRILPEQWEQSYLECLNVLQKFPLPLMTVRKEEYAGQKRWTYTRTLVQEAESEHEHWEVCGDLLSKRQAECFRLYRNFNKHFASKTDWTDQDVLWSPHNQLHYLEGNGLAIFANKTQGYPYHLAVLAVSILLENRFPYSVYVVGDIERYQIEMMVEWLNTIVESPVTLPVCMDGSALYQRLQALYALPRAIIERFKTLYRGSHEETLSQLLQHAERAEVLSDFQQDLARFNSLSQFGAQSLLNQFISVTQDLPLTIATVQAIQRSQPEQAEFTLEALLKRLCKNYITIAPAEREVLSIFARSAQRMPTIQDAFANFYLQINGAPRPTDYYMDAPQLLAIFSRYAPEKQELFATIIADTEEQCRTSLQTLRQKLTQKLPVPDDTIPTPAESTSINSETETAGTLSPSADYIVRQGELQQERFRDLESSAQTMGLQAQQMLDLYPEEFQSEAASYYHRQIDRASGVNGFALDERIWQRIEQETSLPILRRILAIALISSRESNFWHWRRYILEQPSLWHYLVANE